MTAKELLTYSLDATERHLNRALTGVMNADLDLRATSEGMSIREHLEHLVDVAQATLDILAGREHDWDSYQLPGATLEDLTDAWMARRQLARIAVEREDDEALKHGIDYLALHDGYHVGQIALTRHALDPTWNSHSLYG